jgi:hypothetical protein
MAPARLTVMDGVPKVPALVALIDRLRHDLGPRYFIEVPHWDGDLTATGLGRPDDPRFLVYLAVQPGSREVYFECEIPSADDTAGALYDVAGSGSHADYRQILDIVRNHLDR